MQDRKALFVIWTFLAVLVGAQCVASSAHAEYPGAVPGDRCDDYGEKRVHWTKSEREQLRARAWKACKSAGASDLVCTFHDMIMRRESSYEGDVRHGLGDGEDGLGPHGLSLKVHGYRWGADADPAFCTPEISFAVAHAIFVGAVRKWGPLTLPQLQGLYGQPSKTIRCEPDTPARLGCDPTLQTCYAPRCTACTPAPMPARRGSCVVQPPASVVRNTLRRMSGYGLDPYKLSTQRVTLSDLGNVSGWSDRSGRLTAETRSKVRALARSASAD